MSVVILHFKNYSLTYYNDFRILKKVQLFIRKIGQKILLSVLIGHHQFISQIILW